MEENKLKKKILEKEEYKQFKTITKNKFKPKILSTKKSELGLKEGGVGVFSKKLKLKVKGESEPGQTDHKTTEVQI